MCRPHCGCGCGSGILHVRQRSTDSASRWFSAQPLRQFKGFFDMVFYKLSTTINFSHRKLFFLPCVLPFVLNSVGAWRRLRLERRKERIFKVPQSKFWCPGCAPAAVKSWRRHCMAPFLQMSQLTESYFTWCYEAKIVVFCRGCNRIRSTDTQCEFWSILANLARKHV